MAKGNYKSVIATAAPVQNDISAWIMQQEQMNLQARHFNDQRLRDAEKKIAERDKALADKLANLGYGTSPEFKMTGVEALDYNQRMLAAETIEKAGDLDKRIIEAEKNRALDPFQMAKLKHEREQLNKIPERLSIIQQKFKEEVEEWTKGVADGKIIATPENMSRLKRLHDGEYKLVLDPTNVGSFMVVFDQDGDGVDDYIPFEDFMSDKSIGYKVRNVDMMNSAMEFGKALGKSENMEESGLYKITEKGLKYNDQQLKSLVLSMAESNVDDANSFAYQHFGKMYKDLDDSEKEVLVSSYINYAKMGVDESYKKEFNAGLANYQLGRDRLAHTKSMDEQKLALAYKKFDAEQGGKGTPGSIKIDEVIGNGVPISINAPTYSTPKLKVQIGDPSGEDPNKSVEILSVSAIPEEDGRVRLIGWDGTNSHSLDEGVLPALKKHGITKENVIKYYNELNNSTENERLLDDPLDLGL